MWSKEKERNEGTDPERHIITYPHHSHPSTETELWLEDPFLNRKITIHTQSTSKKFF